MAVPIIEAKDISKCYKIGLSKQGYLSLREEIFKLGGKFKSGIAGVFSKDYYQSTESEQNFWALKDVSFTIHQGEAVGIIGRNGAGKSTLLKILSQITPPTKGTIKIHGRIASLLEVGTGFHPELTGRENIYLNGTILGMSRKEVALKFDEIVGFAEVSKFLDTPVKRYSSGMYVRLAFSVAAHLEPEILVVDEVLAVGDIEFQKKCLGKMGEVSKGGRTVIFVSHNMAAISSFCNKSILINGGCVDYIGLTGNTIERYLNNVSTVASIKVSERKDRKGSGVIRFTDIWIENDMGDKIMNISSGSNCKIVATYKSENHNNHKNVNIAFALRGSFNENITNLCNDHSGYAFSLLPPKGRVECKLISIPLNEGRYRFNVFCSINGEISDSVIDVGEIHVVAGDYYKTGQLPGKGWGPFLMKQEWTCV
ncbi:MAG: ABC transporter ATP-binding protein [Chlorobiaceae bacterium]